MCVVSQYNGFGVNLKNDSICFDFAKSMHFRLRDTHSVSLETIKSLLEIAITAVHEEKDSYKN